MPRSTILLLEDDINLSETVSEYLEEKGYEVECSYDGEDAQDKIYEKRYDLLLLDVNVPGINGFEILKNSREEGTFTPAIFITSLDSVDDLSVGYESGCDDYIRKPFELKEMFIRIESILKREFYHVNSEKINIDSDMYYDIQNNQIFKKGKAVALHNKEAKLLKLFLQNPNRIISHEKIQEALWDYEEEPSDAALRTYIKNLRKILGKDKIVSIKKLGYKLQKG